MTKPRPWPTGALWALNDALEAGENIGDLVERYVAEMENPRGSNPHLLNMYAVSMGRYGARIVRVLSKVQTDPDAGNGDDEAILMALLAMIEAGAPMEAIENLIRARLGE